MFRNIAVINLVQEDNVIKVLLVEENQFDEALKLLDKLDQSKITIDQIDDNLYELFNQNNLKLEIPYTYTSILI